MPAPDRQRPFYIRSGSTASFAVFHEPAAAAAAPEKPAVLFSPPWGWDDVASYRVRREWANRLAAAGFPTLRIDLPATGNSDGSVEDSKLPSDWVTAVGASATWLAESTEAAGVATLGFGLGGLLALLAVMAGAPIAALALWGSPSGGRRFVRETKAFSRLQPWYEEAAAGGFDPGVREGWLEAGGFTLSPDTLASLGDLAPTPTPASGLRRVLLLDRDGVAADPKLTEALESSGAEVEKASGAGWGDLISHPEEATLPAAVADAFERWLLERPLNSEPNPEAGSTVEGVASIELGDGAARVREEAVALSFSWGNTVGIFDRPEPGVDSDLCAVFLNAGAVRSTGPNRLWVETARRWAGRGVSTVRIDLEGIGDADGERSGELRVGDFYRPQYGAQVRELLDELQRRGVADRFFLVGLCAGGYWAFRTAIEDDRVVAGTLLNAGALRWRDDLVAQREARKSSRAFERRWWGKLLHGEVGAKRLLQLVRSVLANGFNALRRLLARPFGGAPASSLRRGIEADLDGLRDSRTRVLIAFSGEEPLGAEVEHDGLDQRGERWPNLEFARLPGSDHTLRPPSAQRAAAELLDRELDRVLADATSRKSAA